MDGRGVYNLAMRLKNDSVDSHLEELNVYADLEQPMWLTSPQTLSYDCIVSPGYFRSPSFVPSQNIKITEFCLDSSFLIFLGPGYQ